jgi:hypothetical protein
MMMLAIQIGGQAKDAPAYDKISTGGLFSSIHDYNSTFLVM